MEGTGVGRIEGWVEGGAVGGTLCTKGVPPPGVESVERPKAANCVGV